MFSWKLTGNFVWVWRVTRWTPLAIIPKVCSNWRNSHRVSLHKGRKGRGVTFQALLQYNAARALLLGLQCWTASGRDPSTLTPATSLITLPQTCFMLNPSLKAIFIGWVSLTVIQALFTVFTWKNTQILNKILEFPPCLFG